MKLMQKEVIKAKYFAEKASKKLNLISWLTWVMRLDPNGIGFTDLLTKQI
jgi:hypothetical protein